MNMKPNNSDKPFQIHNGNRYAVIRTDVGRRLAVTGDRLDSGLEGTIERDGPDKVFVGRLTPGNAAVVMDRFPYTRPVSHRGQPFTLGLGDRLGIASTGHIRSLSGHKVFPVLAQQSMRELRLTGRSYEEVLADVAFAVFEETYTGGYGADGDHLKTPEEIRYALDCGYTMITLDCSDHIDNTVPARPDKESRVCYAALPETVRRRYEEKYIGSTIPGMASTPFRREDLVPIVLIYHKAIDFAVKMFNETIRPLGRPIDFEISIDETLTSTDPKATYVFARELQDAHVEFVSLAPRFCGEFQKGIDYIGDPDRFAAEMKDHASIADALDFKLSVHSGSDKFTVFPAVGALTGLNVHVKTAGTSWLEALRVLALHNAPLYREIHSFALAHVEEAKKYYHIGTKSETIPPLDDTADDRLAGYLDRADSRQALHITYGLILQAETENGQPLFKERLFDSLYRHDEDYARILQTHIGKHLAALGSS